jgi:hypothetical protein
LIIQKALKNERRKRVVICMFNKVIAFEREHAELLRQEWILRMLNSRRDWCDGEAIRYQLAELEAILRHHLQTEQERETIHSIDLEERSEHFADLMVSMRDLQPLTDKWEAIFQEFQTTLHEHVQNRSFGFSSTPNARLEEESTNQSGELIAVH